jgi:hypothetical protein
MEKLLPFSFLLFPIVWCAACGILAVIGGWSALAAHFRTYEIPRGKKFGMQSGRVGIINYSSCLTVHVDDEGMFLAVFPLFRVGHPPLFIPWHEFNNCREKKILLWPFDEVFVGIPPIARLQLRQGILPAAIVNASRAKRPEGLPNAPP